MNIEHEDFLRGLRAALRRTESPDDPDLDDDVQRSGSRLDYFENVCCRSSRPEGGSRLGAS